MPFSTTTFEILVAGPSDVSGHRRLIKTAIDEWNQRHSQSLGITLRAVGWENVRPQLGDGDGPQAVINNRLVDRCDAIVAVFGARLGTKTPTEVSGTVEEIKRFHKLGKSVMVYFSRASIRRENLNLEQYASLEEFRMGLQNLGLVGRFKSPADLRSQVDAHLIQLASDLAAHENDATAQRERNHGPMPGHAVSSLSSRAEVQDRSHKACLSLASIGPIASNAEGSEITFNLRNEGESSAYDVKASFDVGNGFQTEPERVDFLEISPAKNIPRSRSGTPRQYSKSLRVHRPHVDSSGDPIKDQALHIRLRATFRDGLGERDEAIFVVHCRNQGLGWKPVEDRSQATLSPICRFVRPEINPNPAPLPMSSGAAALKVTARPKHLSDTEHGIMEELVRRAAHYPEVFRASIFSLRPGDDQQGYQSDYIKGTRVPSDARTMLLNDRDFTPVLIQQGFLHPESSDKYTIDASLFRAYGFDPPN